MVSTLILSIIILLALVIGWHLIFPILGGVIAITAIAWLVIVGSIVAFCIAIMFLFVLTGTGIFVLGIFALIWMVVAVVLFPVLFPLLIPLFIMFLFISLLRRRQTTVVPDSKKKKRINK